MQVLAAEGMEQTGRRFIFQITPAAAAAAPEPPASLRLRVRADVVDFLQDCIGAYDSDADDALLDAAAGGSAPAGAALLQQGPPADRRARAARAAADEAMPPRVLAPELAATVPPDAAPAGGSAGACGATWSATYDSWREETTRTEQEPDARRIVHFYLVSSADGSEVSEAFDCTCLAG